MTTGVVLQNFKVIRPKYEISQSESLMWLGKSHAQLAKEDSERFIRLFGRFGCGSDKISKRGTEMDDAFQTDVGRMTIFGSPAQSRMQFFNQVVSQRMREFYVDQEPPDHLIHVSCTGYVSPSPAQVLISERNWNHSTEISHAYHMGCYASLPAVRLAQVMVSSGTVRTDIVHTELCTLHLNLADHAPEQMVVQSLFSDGYIRYSAQSLDQTKGKGLEVISILEEIVPNSLQDMTWVISDWGMKMTLAREVPTKLSLAIQPFMKRLLEKAEITQSGFLEEAVFAIHPGGPRIIDQLKSELGLRENQIQQSRSVLLNYGNMSSATLPHIWNDILNDPDVPSGKWIVSLAFGPGLTLFGALMRKNGN